MVGPYNFWREKKQKVVLILTTRQSLKNICEESTPVLVVQMHFLLFQFCFHLQVCMYFKIRVSLYQTMSAEYGLSFDSSHTSTYNIKINICEKNIYINTLKVTVQLKNVKYSVFF